MSTRAAIGIAQADGTIKAIYLHNDGSPTFAGAILAGWYNTAEKAEALIALGAGPATSTAPSWRNSSNPSGKKPAINCRWSWCAEIMRFTVKNPTLTLTISPLRVRAEKAIICSAGERSVFLFWTSAMMTAGCRRHRPGSFTILPPTLQQRQGG